MLASVAHVLPLTIIRRKRVLPVPGKVLVRQGQKVSPRDVIAETVIAPDHLLLSVSRSLGVSSADVKPLLQRQVGDDVEKGDLIAGPVGLTRRVLRAPVAGRIMLIRDGNVLLEVETPPFELRAGLAGVINDLIAEYGAVIETLGALVHGVWGNGQIEFGLLQSKLEEPDGKLSADQLDVSLRGAVILAGYCDNPKALQNAADIPLKGLILSSMAASLVPLASKMPYPIIVLQGFGFRPMDSVSYNLLATNTNREVSVNAVKLDRFTGARPEVVIPLPSTSDPPLPVKTNDYEAGQKVRLVRAPHATEIGTIEHIFDQPMTLPSGLRAISASVELENGETITTALANLEVLT